MCSCVKCAYLAWSSGWVCVWLQKARWGKTCKERESGRKGDVNKKESCIVQIRQTRRGVTEKLSFPFESCLVVNRYSQNLHYKKPVTPMRDNWCCFLLFPCKQVTDKRQLGIGKGDG